MSIVHVSYQDVTKGHLILVNAENPLITQTSKPDLVSVASAYSDIYLEKQTGKILASIMSELQCAQEIIPVSGYRSLQEQQSIYNNSIRENGPQFTAQYVALPNCSEHQTGYAVDVSANLEKINTLTPTFPYYGIFKEFRQLSRKYGFIERYPANKTSITRIAHEPWHFRYVGSPHAQYMFEHDFALEEYISYLKQYPYMNTHLVFRQGRYQFEVFYEEVKFNETKSIEIPDSVPYQISGNNIDGIIVTLWRNA